MGPTEARSPLSCAWLRCRRGLWNLPDRARGSIWAEVLAGLNLLRAREHRTGRRFIRNVREKRRSWGGGTCSGCTGPTGSRERGKRAGGAVPPAQLRPALSAVTPPSRWRSSPPPGRSRSARICPRPSTAPSPCPRAPPAPSPPSSSRRPPRRSSPGASPATAPCRPPTPAGHGRQHHGLRAGGLPRPPAGRPHLPLHPDHAGDLGAVGQVDPPGRPGQVPQAPDVDVVVPRARGPQLLLLRQRGPRGCGCGCGQRAAGGGRAGRYLGEELEGHEGGALLLEGLVHPQLLPDAAVHGHDAVPGACRRGG